MKIDPVAAIRAVTREVNKRDHEGKPATVVIASRVFDTSMDDAWDAITNPERIPRWFLPVTGELKLGGRYQLKGNAGGSITRCEPPRLLALTWEMGPEVSWVTVTLTRQTEEKTLLVLEHMAHVDDERAKKFGPGAVGVGWELGLLGLFLHLLDKKAVDPKAFEAWSMSDEGKQIIARSSEGWGEASIASGTPAAEARAAAAATTAFYTGAPLPDNAGG
ncbi:MAG: SRPBCC family protein [Polyangiaceae bacterium]|nr:SRPBCC family protein [Polyangiaceae bacterium]